VNDNVINALRSKEKKFLEIQKKLDGIKDLLQLSGKDPMFVDYTVVVRERNQLEFNVFGKKFYIFFENYITIGEVVYTEIEEDECKGEIIQSLSVDSLGNLSEPHTSYPSSEFLTVHYAIINVLIDNVIKSKSP
jgi:hypothetical protein